MVAVEPRTPLLPRFFAAVCRAERVEARAPKAEICALTPVSSVCRSSMGFCCRATSWLTIDFESICAARPVPSPLMATLVLMDAPPCW